MKVRPMLMMADETDLSGTSGNEIDWDKFEEDFNKEFTEPDPNQTPANPNEPPAEPVTPEVPPADTNAPPAEPVVDPNKPPVEPEPAKPPVQTPEANRAFQELRLQAESGKKHTAFVQGLADKAGLSVEDFLKAVADQELEAEAKAKGQDPELYKRMRTVEDTLTVNQAELDAERFNNQVNLAMAELKLTPEQVGETFNKAIAMQLNPRSIPFKTLHNLVNPASVDVATIKEQARQEYLEELKQKQDNFVPPSSFSPSSNSDANVADDVKAFLKEKGDI